MKKAAYPRVRVALGCCFCIYACGGRSAEDAAPSEARGGRSPMGEPGGNSGAKAGAAGDPSRAGAGGAGRTNVDEAGRANAGQGGMPTGEAGGVGEVAGGSVGQAGADVGIAGGSYGGITAGGVGQAAAAGVAGLPSGGMVAAGAGGADPSVSSLPATCRELSTELPDGDYLIDPNGGDPSDAFTVTCDLTSDGGGWTLIGRGQWWTAEADVLPPGIDAYLPPGKRARIVEASSSLFRAGAGAQRLFIQDTNALLDAGFHYWRTAGSSVACTTDYQDVGAGTMAITTAVGISCDALGVGSHNCGTLNGWILLHLNDPYNVSGAHPCSLGSGDRPTDAGLKTLWVR